MVFHEVTASDTACESALPLTRRRIHVLLLLPAPADHHVVDELRDGLSGLLGLV